MILHDKERPHLTIQNQDHAVFPPSPLPVREESEGRCIAALPIVQPPAVEHRPVPSPGGQSPSRTREGHTRRRIAA
jgi:hypothetical protein